MSLPLDHPHIKHVSIRMTEHYAKVAVSEIEDILQHIWVAGPAAPNPGELLSAPAVPMDLQQAEALMIDLSRASTPTEGGFCTYQPVVHGSACPWNLNCHSCDKFVLSGADLLYWRRKREQWACIAERAPNDATADYLHQVFAPTAQAIDGLEKALAGLGLLDQALNAEHTLKAAHAEIRAQRARIGELLGQLRDTQHEHDSDATGRLSAENATLRQRIRDLTAGQRTLEERLQGARSNNRFLDKRIAGLEAQLLAAESGT